MRAVRGTAHSLGIIRVVPERNLNPGKKHGPTSLPDRGWYDKTDYSAALAVSQSFAKAASSWMAISESILRLMSMPATFSPCMSLL